MANSFAGHSDRSEESLVDFRTRSFPAPRMTMANSINFHTKKTFQIGADGGRWPGASKAASAIRS
jgi:hypothetical protein